MEEWPEGMFYPLIRDDLRKKGLNFLANALRHGRNPNILEFVVQLLEGKDEEFTLTLHGKKGPKRASAETANAVYELVRDLYYERPPVGFEAKIAELKEKFGIGRTKAAEYLASFESQIETEAEIQIEAQKIANRKTPTKLEVP